MRNTMIGWHEPPMPPPELEKTETVKRKELAVSLDHCLDRASSLSYELGVWADDSLGRIDICADKGDWQAQDFWTEVHNETSRLRKLQQQTLMRLTALALKCKTQEAA